MKKTVSILLIFIFLVSQILFPFVFKTLQILVKLEIEYQRQELNILSNLITIELDKSESNKINWVESGKEFRIDEKMYDVINTFETDSKIIFYCINDLKEENLFEILGNILSSFIHNFSDKNSADNNISKKLNLSPFIIRILQIHSIVNSAYAYTEYFNNYKSFIKDIPSEPPELIKI